MILRDGDDKGMGLPYSKDMLYPEVCLDVSILSGDTFPGDHHELIPLHMPGETPLHAGSRSSLPTKVPRHDIDLEPALLRTLRVFWRGAIRPQEVSTLGRCFTKCCALHFQNWRSVMA